MLRHRNEYPVEGQLPAFEGATAWLNSGPVTADSVQERVSCMGLAVKTSFLAGAGFLVLRAGLVRLTTA